MTIENNKIISSTKEIADFFKVVEKYVSELVNKHGMPKIDHNKFDFILCAEWWLNYQAEINKKEIERIKSEKSQDLVNRKNAEFKDLLIQEKLGNLIDRFQVEETWLTQISVIINNIDVLPINLAPLLKNKSDEKEIQKILNDATEKIKERISSARIELPELPSNEKSE